MFTQHNTGEMLGWNENKTVKAGCLNQSSVDVAQTTPNVTHVAHITPNVAHVTHVAEDIAHVTHVISHIVISSCISVLLTPGLPGIPL